MSNLAQRVLTAVVLIPLVVTAILLLRWEWVGLLFGVAVLAAAWEWTHLAGWQALPSRLAFVVVTAALLAASSLLPRDAVLAIAALATLWWLFALIGVVGFERGWSPATRSWFVWMLAGWLVLVPAWLALVQVHRATERGPELVLVLMVLIWLADIGTYFAGRAFGARKLARRVSPGKTWEGVAGGAVVSIVAAVAYAFAALGAAWPGFVLLAVLTVAVSVLGDLAESLFKRVSGTKDSGGLLPGHGGVLDRIDSLTAASPVFLLGATFIGVVA